MSISGWRAIFTAVNLRYLSEGLLTSLELAAAAVVLSLVFGSLLSLWMFGIKGVWGYPARFYVNIFRHIPLLVSAFFLAFGLPVLGFNIDPFIAGVIAMTLANTAYIAEALRGALESVSRGQLDAALSTGLTRWAANRLIIYPQGLFRAIPVVVGQCIVMVQGTALLSALGIADLTFRSTNLASRLGNPLEVTLFIGAIYYVVDKLLAVTRAILERKVASRMIS